MSAPGGARPSGSTEPSHATVSGLLFDQWSRYQALARGIRALLPNGGNVLDVGSGEACLLGRFLPEHHVTYLDPLLAGKQHGNRSVIAGPLDQAHVADGSFDVVTCVDVLEHVPPNQRQQFLAQMVRASRLGVVIAAPFADVGDAKATDDHVHIAYRAKTGHDYSWLAEHDQYGLPRFDETEATLHAQGLQSASFGNGHAPWLRDLLARHVLLLDAQSHTPMLREVGDRFAAELLPFDHLEPCYRQVLVARRGPTTPELPTLPDQQTCREAAAAAWRRFSLWLEARIAAHADALAERNTDLSRRLKTSDRLQREALRRAEQAEALAQRRITDANQQLRQSDLDTQQHQLAAQRANEQLVAMQRSLCWRATAPVRATLGAMRSPRSSLLRAAQWTLAHTIPQRLRWPLKSAFFWLLRPVLGRTREYREFLDAKRWRDRPPPPPVTDIAEARPDRCDIVVLGVIDWHLRIQRPQQLALEFARRGHRVFYFTPGFRQDSQPGFVLEQLEPNLPAYQIRLQVSSRASIYEEAPRGAAAAQLADGLRQCLATLRLDVNLCLVDHPGWVDLATLLPRSRLIYDCMDNHHGFAETGSSLPAVERRLLNVVQGVVVTSDYIEAEMRPRHRNVCMVRNACEPTHFAPVPAVGSNPARQVIGYFGAVAQWFDVDLLRAVAQALPECDFLIVGADSAEVQHRLGAQPNVAFVGEVPYQQLPEHLARMHVLLIPFVIDALTLATNPVKAYEALAAGRPVVATEMPELMQTDLAPFVRTAADAAGIVRQLRAALAESRDPIRTAAMRDFAAEQTWASRAADVLQFVDELPQPTVGVVVVSWNGVELTRRCVASVLDDPQAGDVEVVIVDNASSDATPAWLDEIECHPRVQVIRNADNRGFAAACNQGLAAAAVRDPKLLVILNNDIVVTPGWTTTMLHHLQRDPQIGLLGPVTNNIGNEAKLDTSYRSLAEMPMEQLARTGGAAGRSFEIPVLAFFCVAIPLDVYRTVGGLDENFGTGFFEDDDYCQRVRQLGRKLVCAEDVFVHHELSASFSRIDQGERQKLFDRNRAYYESKWGPWQRHTYRAKPPRDDAAVG